MALMEQQYMVRLLPKCLMIGMMITQSKNKQRNVRGIECCGEKIKFKYS